jgi:hypothetical protein
VDHDRRPNWRVVARPLSADEIVEFEQRFVDHEYFDGAPDVEWPSEDTDLDQ